MDPEKPQTAVTIAGEDVREAIVADECLNAPEVVACGVQVTTNFHKLAGAGVRRDGALTLGCAQPARVLRQVGQRWILRIASDPMDRSPKPSAKADPSFPRFPA